jgi:hypothetical protein
MPSENAPLRPFLNIPPNIKIQKTGAEVAASAQVSSRF